MDQKKKNNWSSLAQFTGEDQVKRIRYNVSYLKFHGSKGEFFLLTKDSMGNLKTESFGKKILGVILKVRRIYFGYERTQDGSISYFTNEHNSFNDHLLLFERRSTHKKNKLIGTGKIDEIRKIKPNLKLRQYWYMLIENPLVKKDPKAPKDLVVKLGIKGGSLKNVFDYYREFGPSEHLCQFLTEITPQKETNEAGLEYFVMNFSKKKEADFAKVEPAVKEVAEALEEQDKSFAQNFTDLEDSREVKEQETKTVPEQKSKPEEVKTEDSPAEEFQNFFEVKDDENEDEIKIEDIPL